MCHLRQPVLSYNEVSATFPGLQHPNAQLQRSFRNVPRAATSKAPCTGICHLCLGGQPGYDYEDVPLKSKLEIQFLSIPQNIWSYFGVFFRPYTEWLLLFDVKAFVGPTDQPLSILCLKNFLGMKMTKLLLPKSFYTNLTRNHPSISQMSFTRFLWASLRHLLHQVWQFCKCLRMGHPLKVDLVTFRACTWNFAGILTLNIQDLFSECNSIVFEVLYFYCFSCTLYWF